MCQKLRPGRTNTVRWPAFSSLFPLLLAFVLCAAGLGTSCAATHERKARREAEAERVREAQRAPVADCLPPAGTAPTPDVAPLYGKLIEFGNLDALRYCYAIAVRAAKAGRNSEAARVLDAAVARLEANTAGDASAKKARSTFRRESRKNFRGEPYEQAMIYLLRALLYMEAEDFENARAMLRSGALCDASSAGAPPGEQYHDDLAEMDYLEALCDLKLDRPERASDKLAYARKHARTPSAVQSPGPSFNTVVVLFAGSGPRKYGDGRYGELLRFEHGRGAGSPMRLLVDGEGVAEADGPIDNMSFQATTRGGRVIDSILEGKAHFKGGASAAGDAALIAAGATRFIHDDSTSDAFRLGFLAAALLFKGISASAKPAADTRALVPMPDDIYVFPIDLAPGQHALELRGPGQSYRSGILHRGASCQVAVLWDSQTKTLVQSGNEHKRR